MNIWRCYCFFLKSLLNLLHYRFCFLFWFFGSGACWTLLPQPGIVPVSPALKGKVLITTGPPSKSQKCYCVFSFYRWRNWGLQWCQPQTYIYEVNMKLNPGSWPRSASSQPLFCEVRRVWTCWSEMSLTFDLCHSPFKVNGEPDLWKLNPIISVIGSLLWLVPPAFGVFLFLVCPSLA